MRDPIADLYIFEQYIDKLVFKLSFLSILMLLSNYKCPFDQNDNKKVIKQFLLNISFTYRRIIDIENVYI